MKRSFCLLLSIVAVFIFGVSSMSLAGTHEAKPAATAATKITKDQAKHIALFANHGSTIEGCELVQGKDHPNWAVSVVRAGAATAIQVQVDGVTGKIIP
jgi:uncharacterized membrane protein YkoI